MKNHYVSQFLLKNFVGKDNKLSEYDKGWRKWSSKSPAQVAREPGIYDDADEKWRNIEIEQPAQIGLSKLVRGEQIEFSERKAVAKFISALIYGNPRIIEAVTDEVWAESNLADILGVFNKAAIDLGATQGAQYLSELMALPPDQQLSELGVPQTSTGAPDLLKWGFRKEMALDSFLPELAWRVVHSKRERYIITDVPVYVHPMEGGPNSPNFELVLPLSTFSALHISRQGECRSLDHITSDFQAKRISVNVLGVKQVKRIYCSRKEKWVERTAHRQRFRPYIINFGAQKNINVPYGEYCSDCGQVYTEQELDTTTYSYNGDKRQIEISFDHLCVGRKGTEE